MDINRPRVVPKLHKQMVMPASIRGDAEIVEGSFLIRPLIFGRMLTFII